MNMHGNVNETRGGGSQLEKFSRDWQESCIRFQVRLKITRRPGVCSAGKIRRVFHEAHLPNLPREPSIRRDGPAEVAIQHRRTKHGVFGLRDETRGAGGRGSAFATEPTAVFPR